MFDCDKGLYDFTCDYYTEYCRNCGIGWDRYDKKEKEQVQRRIADQKRLANKEIPVIDEYKSSLNDYMAEG